MILQSFRPHLKTLTRHIFDYHDFSTNLLYPLIYDSRLRSRGTSHNSRIANIRFVFGGRSAHDDRLIRFHRYPQREGTIVRQKFVFRPASSLHDRQQPPRVQRIEDRGGVEVAMGGELARVALGNATFYRVWLAPTTLGHR